MARYVFAMGANNTKMILTAIDELKGMIEEISGSKGRANAKKCTVAIMARYVFVGHYFLLFTYHLWISRFCSLLIFSTVKATS